MTSDRRKCQMRAKFQSGRIAQGDNPAEEHQLDHKALNHQGALHALPQRLNAGLVLGKGWAPHEAQHHQSAIGA